jgi:hypothetical protein
MTCANCGASITGKRHSVAIFPNRAGGTAMYPLCADKCALLFKVFGLAGIPEVVKDSELTVAMSPYNPANRAAFKRVQ